MSEWKLISEDAPLGKLVIAYWPPSVQVGYRRDLSYHKRRTAETWANASGSPRTAPTHWMPLPEPPVELPGKTQADFSAGIKAAADWVRARHDAWFSENGYVEPDTNSASFGTGPHAHAKEEYDCELTEIEEGIRALAASLPGATAAADVMPKDWRVLDFAELAARDVGIDLDTAFKVGYLAQQMYEAALADQNTSAEGAGLQIFSCHCATDEQRRLCLDKNRCAKCEMSNSDGGTG